MPDIKNYLAVEDGRITYDIEERVLPSSCWTQLVNRVPWDAQMGVNPQNMEWQRPWVETENDWADVTLNDGTGTTCLPPVDVVEINHKLREMKLQQKAIESPEFCVTDLIYAGGQERQMQLIVDNLSEQARWIWAKRHRSEYHRVCRNKVILESGLTGHGDDNEDDAGFPVGATPTSILVNGALDFFYRELLLEGALNDALFKNGSKPIFALITDVFTSRKLIRSDDTIREDIRNSEQVELLLGPLGIDTTYNGFVHMIDEMPRRFDWVVTSAGGSWVERAPFIATGSPGDAPGREIIVNPAWINAAYQDSYIYCPSVMDCLVPPSITGSAGFDYEPQNYVGEFGFRNIAHKTDNPDGRMGFFRGTLMSGTKIRKPQWGYVIRHQVCDRDLGLIPCP